MDVTSHATNIYHVSGIDDRERGFNRQAHVTQGQDGYEVRLRYERLSIAVEACPAEEEALRRLIQELQEKGYTQLRTQRIFTGPHYLGNQDLWVEYPDPPSAPEPGRTWAAWFRRLFTRST